MKSRGIAPALLFMLLFLATPLFAGQDQAGIEECNTFYHNGEFMQAIDCYQHIGGGYSSSVLFNLGNSYAQTGRIGQAILHYQRALCLAPGDSDIKGNLSLVREEEGLFPPESSFIEKTADLCTINQWALLALAAVAAYLVFAIFQLRYRQRRAVEAMVILCCTAMLIIGVFGTAIKYDRWNKSVVLSDSKILISPYENAAQAGMAKQGRLLNTHKQHGQFNYITDETGQKGWIVREHIAPIVKDK